MSTLAERDQNTIVLARTLGLLPPDATPREAQDYAEQVTDQQVLDMSRQLHGNAA